MRPPALTIVLLSASILAAGCVASDEDGTTKAPPVDATQTGDPEIVAASFAPPEQVGSCVEQIKFGAYTGDAAWTQVWNDAGQTDDGATGYCTQLWANNAGELAQVHQDWLELEAFLAAAEPANETPPPVQDAPAPEPAPATTERPPEIPPSGPDLNCPDIGRTVWVGSNDYHNLDDDDDGWGCDSYS